MENTVWFAKTSERELSPVCRALLAHALGFSPRVAYLEGGKPWLPDNPALHISLAHTRGAVAVALSGFPVGVDVEGPRRVNLRLAGRCFTAPEQAYAVDEARFLEIWTRKEALLKRDGRGITVRLTEVEALGSAEISTRMVEDFTLSFCGTPETFVLNIVQL